MTVKHVQMSVESLRAELDEFEARYETPSEQLTEAFRNWRGRLKETDDFRRWSTVYAAWSNALKARGRRPESASA